MKNGLFVLDAHCHIYPAAIAAKAAAAIGTFYNHHSVCTGTAEEIIEINKEAGIDMSLVQSAATLPHPPWRSQSPRTRCFTPTDAPAVFWANFEGRPEVAPYNLYRHPIKFRISIKNVPLSSSSVAKDLGTFFTFLLSFSRGFRLFLYEA